MAYYKVPQDVEAEDKLVFGLTFKQFVFAIVFFVSGFVGFQLAKSSAILVGPILPVFIISGVLAFYRPKDQPAETKLLAYINYYFRSRRRIWSRDGLLEHVVINSPQPVDRQPFVRSQAQVRSQLKLLAQIVDTRGWATKHSEIQLPTVGTATLSHVDRLIAPQEVQVVGQAQPITLDIFDESNPEARLLDQREEATKQRSLDEAKQKMHQAKIAAESPPAKVANVHAFGPSASPPEPETSTPLTPRFDPFPKGIHQKVLGVSPPTAQAQLQQLADDDESPVSVVAQQANRLTKEQTDASNELKIQH